MFEYIGGGALIALVLLVFVGWPAYRAMTRRQIAASWSTDAERLGLAESDAYPPVAQELDGLGPIHFPVVVRRLVGDEASLPFSMVLFTYKYRNVSSSSGDFAGADGEGTAVIVERPLPTMRCVPGAASNEEAFDKLPEMFQAMVNDSARPVRIPDDPTFGEKVKVTGPDADAIREALTPALRSFLVEHSERTLMGNGRVAVWWAPDLFGGPGLETFVTEARALCRALQT